MSNFSTYTFPDGGLYIGTLDENGLPHSVRASCVWPDGRSYLGSWVNGTMSGIGTLYKNGVAVRYGYWWDGELLNEAPIRTEAPLSETPISNKKIVALLIGNDNYSYPSTKLDNCVSDVRAIAEKLQKIGVDTIVQTDLSKDAMVDSIVRLCKEKGPCYENVLFYFSGHGATNQGRHYIMATDESASPSYPISLELLDEKLSPCFSNVILISDACASIQEGNWDTDPVNGGPNTIIDVSTSLGHYSWDGVPGGHSPFAFGLLEYIDKEMSIVEILEEANKFASIYAAKVLNKYQLPLLIHAPFYAKDFCLY